jgi:hypothetical protein
LTARRLLPLAILVCSGPVLLYLFHGTAGGFFAADDFQWLTGARDGSWADILAIGDGARFYRPVVRLWFVGAVAACGPSSPCYHLLHLGLHVLNGLLLFTLTFMVSRDRFTSAASTLIFMVMPGYVEAVQWVCAATEVLSATFILLTALLTLLAADAVRPGLWWLGALCALLAVFAHESGVASLLLVPCLLLVTGRRDTLQARRLWPFAAVGVVFALAVAFANWRNPLLTTGDYRLGPHMLRHALDYVASLYVGPRAAIGYVTSVAALVAVAASGSTPARVGLMWMFVTMLPFLGFLSGVTSRYQYAPAMGFALMVAALVTTLLEALARRTSRLAAAGAVGLCLVFTVVRFAGFTGEAIRDRLAWFDAYRAYADVFRAEHPVLPDDGQITAPQPQHPNVMPEYIQPMLRWIYRRGDLIVTVVPGPAPTRGPGL